MNLFTQVIVSAIVFISLDLLYMYLNKRMLQHTVIYIQRTVIQPRHESFLLCYLLLLSGLWYFIILKRRSIEEAFALGILIYGVFESTNYGIFKKWPIELAVIDTVWGGALFALTTSFVYYIKSN